MSHDLEDVVTVIDGRPELLDEIKASEPELQEYLAKAFKTLITQDDFVTAIQGYLPGDAASQARLSGLMQRLETIATSE